MIYGHDFDNFYYFDLSYVVWIRLLIFTILTYRTIFKHDFDNFYDID